MHSVQWRISRVSKQFLRGWCFTIFNISLTLLRACAMFFPCSIFVCIISISSSPSITLTSTSLPCSCSYNSSPRNRAWIICLVRLKASCNVCRYHITSGPGLREILSLNWERYTKENPCSSSPEPLWCCGLRHFRLWNPKMWLIQPKLWCNMRTSWISVGNFPPIFVESSRSALS